MKRREVIKQIARAARVAGVEWAVKREGGNHTVFTLDGLLIPIPRHNEIDDRMARKIFGECEPKLGEDWWR